MKNKRLLITIFGGWFGLHHYLDHNYLKGLLYTFTCGAFYIGWICDIYNEYKKTKSPAIETDSKGENEVIHNDINVEPQETIEPVIKQTSKPKHTIDLKGAYQQSKTLVLTNDYVVVDTETTGFNPERDRIFELSAIKYKDGKEMAQFSELINPQRILSDTIQKLTGVKNEDLKDKPLIDEALPKFINFIEDYTLIAHNASFDFKMIISECARCGLDPITNKIIDTLTLAKRYYSDEDVPNKKLETFKKYFNLDTKSHRALDDCITCNYLYRDVIKRINNTFDLEDEEKEAVSIIRDILVQNDRDATLLRARVMSNNVLNMYNVYHFMHIKTRGKIKYVAFNKDIVQEDYDFSNFKLSNAAKSEDANFRIAYDSLNDLYKLKDIILDVFDKMYKKTNRLNNDFKNDASLEGYNPY